MTLLTLAWRLGSARGAGGGARQLVVMVAVALCVAGLALAAAVPPALQDRGARQAARQPATAPQPAPGIMSADARLLVQQVSSSYRGRPFSIIRLAALSADPPVPPGLTELPGLNEAAVSPSLGRLLTGGQGEVLRGRVPGKVTAQIGDAGLVEQDELVAYVTLPVDELAVLGTPTSGWGSAQPTRYVSVGLRTTAAIGGLAVLIPLVLLIRTSAGLARESRERRARALFLIGLAGGRLRLVLLADVLVGALAGTLLALTLHQGVLSAALAGVPPPGFRFGPQDLQLSGWLLAAIPLTVWALTVYAAQEEQRASEEDVIPGSTQPIEVPSVRPPSTVWFAALAAGIAMLAGAFTLREDALRGGPESYLLPGAVLVLAVTFAPVAQRLSLTTARRLVNSESVPAALGAARYMWNRRPTSRPLLGLGLTCLLGGIMVSALPLFAESRVGDAALLSQGLSEQVLVGGAPSAALKEDLPVGAVRLDVAIPADRSQRSVIVASCDDLARILAQGYGCRGRPVLSRPLFREPGMIPEASSGAALPQLLLQGGPTALIEPAGVPQGYENVLSIVVLPLEGAEPRQVEQARDQLALAGVLGAETVKEKAQAALREVSVYRYLIYVTLGFLAFSGGVGLVSGVAAQVLERRQAEHMLRRIGGSKALPGRALVAELLPAALVCIGLATTMAISVGVTYLSLNDDRPLSGPARGYPFELLTVLVSICLLAVGVAAALGHLLLRRGSADAS